MYCVVGHCFGKVYINKIKEIMWWKYIYIKQAIWLYLCFLLFCTFRPLIFFRTEPKNLSFERKKIGNMTNRSEFRVADLACGIGQENSWSRMCWAPKVHF
jgi:hypothetical protein